MIPRGGLKVDLLVSKMPFSGFPVSGLCRGSGGLQNIPKRRCSERSVCFCGFGCVAFSGVLFALAKRSLNGANEHSSVTTGITNRKNQRTRSCMCQRSFRNPCLGIASSPYRLQNTPCPIIPQKCWEKCIFTSPSQPPPKKGKVIEKVRKSATGRPSCRGPSSTR